MVLDPASALFELGKTAIEKIWPDPSKRAEELYKLEQLKAAGNTEDLQAHVQLMLAQIKVNEVEAASSNLFVAGGRPFIIWVGGFSLAYTFIVHPLLCGFLTVLEALQLVTVHVVPPGMPDTAPLMTLVTALLGVGALRSYDKKQGTQTDTIVKPS